MSITLGSLSKKVGGSVKSCDTVLSIFFISQMGEYPWGSTPGYRCSVMGSNPGNSPAFLICLYYLRRDNEPSLINTKSEYIFPSS